MTTPMREVDNKLTRSGETIKLYRLKLNRPRFVISNNPDVIIHGVEPAFKEWDKIYDYRETLKYAAFNKGGVSHEK
jgi:hypothetical protein